MKILRSLLPIALLAVTSSVYSTAWFAIPSGVSDTGFQLSTTFQPMSSYNGLVHYAGAAPSNSFINPGVINFQLSQPSETATAFQGSSSFSPTGTYGGQLLFRPGAMDPGDMFTITLQFPFGLTYGHTVGNMVTTNQGGVSVPGQVRPGGFTFSEGIAVRTTNQFGTPVSSAGQEISITGTEWDGSAPDFSSAIWGGTGTGSGGNHVLYNWQDSGNQATLSAGNSVATFTDDGNAGLGAGLRDYGEHGWSELEVKWTAGADGFDDDTVFRLSLDGAPVPEPSSALLGFVFGLTALFLRRRR